VSGYQAEQHISTDCDTTSSQYGRVFCGSPDEYIGFKFLADEAHVLEATLEGVLTI
jgi:hypothetical protein